MHLRAPSPEAQSCDSTYKHRLVDKAREQYSRDSERSPNVETGAVFALRPLTLTGAEKDVEFAAEVSLFQHDKAVIPDPFSLTKQAD
jgi:hypothetical protein